MSALMDLLQSSLKGSSLGNISQKLGQDEQTTSHAINAALPMLIGALSRSTKSDGGAGLARALEKKHDGTVLNDLSAHVAQDDEQDGRGILKHVLGGNRDAAAQVLGMSSGIGSDKAESLMATLAPVVLGALGKARAENKLGGQDLTRLLDKESESLHRRTPSMMNAVWGLLDADGDGDTDMSDLLKRGSSGLTRLLR
ncbi:MAG: DUF937 domain-containing protein [Gammaproteobacteria bacterium]|nr:DUF937 domain-containing protein [Gammaproteobacteria bacterium]